MRGTGKGEYWDSRLETESGYVEAQWSVVQGGLLVGGGESGGVGGACSDLRQRLSLYGRN